MSLKVGQVPGGAGSGTRFRQGLADVQARKPNWHYKECGGTNKGSWIRCLTSGCNERRPR